MALLPNAPSSAAWWPYSDDTSAQVSLAHMRRGAWWGLLVLGLVVARSARRSWHRRGVHGAVNAGLPVAVA
jgi:hypothetical protein